MNTGMTLRVQLLGILIPRVACLALAIGSARPAAAQRYWDINGADSGATWDSTAPGGWGVDDFWSTSSTGAGATAAWTPGQQAVFSAGTNAAGAFTVTVSSNQIASGIVFQEGTLTLSGGTITLTNGVGDATINVASDRIATIASGIAGADGLIKSGTGTLILSGVNVFSGIAELRAGMLCVASDFALGNSTLSLGGGTLIASGAPRTLDNPVLISASSKISGSQDITFDGNVSQRGKSTLTIDNSGRTTFSGSTLTLAEDKKNRTLTVDVSGGDVSIANIIQNGTGNGGDGLTKEGGGTLILTGDNTFTGTLTHNAGTLVLGHDSAAGKGTLAFGSDVTVAATGGTRTITNHITFDANLTFGGTDSLVFSGSFSLGGDRAFTVENTTTFNGAISGAGHSLTKNGSGTLILAGINTFGGPSDSLSINAGTVALGHDNAAGAALNTLVLNGGAVEAFGGPRTLANRIVIANSSTIGGERDLSFSGFVSHRRGNHTLTINNSGLTTFSGPALVLAANNEAGTLTFDVSGLSGGVIISSAIQGGSGTGADQLIKNGTGNLTLAGAGANTFSGGLTVNAGTVTAAKTNALGLGPLTVNDGIVDVADFNQAVGTLTLAGGTINGTGGALTASDFQIQSGRVSAILRGAGALHKSTPGTLILNGPNSYTGGTRVDAGTLLVENTTGSGTGTGLVTVNNGGVLGGTGTILGPINLNSGGAISPGVSPGMLNTVSETWNSGSEFLVEMNDADAGEGVGWDLLNIAGSLTLNASSSSQIIVNLRSLTLANAAGEVHDFTNTLSCSWRLITTTGGIQFNLGENEDTVFDLSLGEFNNDTGGGNFRLDLANGNMDLVLSFDPAFVPEPRASSMMGLGILCFLAWRRFLRSS